MTTERKYCSVRYGKRFHGVYSYKKKILHTQQNNTSLFLSGKICSVSGWIILNRVHLDCGVRGVSECNSAHQRVSTLTH